VLGGNCVLLRGVYAISANGVAMGPAKIAIWQLAVWSFVKQLNGLPTDHLWEMSFFLNLRMPFSFRRVQV
jgi:hypothetical protein